MSENLCGNCHLWAPNFYTHVSAPFRGVTCCADAAMDLPASFIPHRQTMSAGDGDGCICWAPIDAPARPITVRKDAGDGVLTKTRAPAEVLSGHSAVIWLDGISGCYLLDRVTPISGERP